MTPPFALRRRLVVFRRIYRRVVQRWYAVKGFALDALPLSWRRRLRSPLELLSDEQTRGLRAVRRAILANRKRNRLSIYAPSGEEIERVSFNVAVAMQTAELRDRMLVIRRDIARLRIQQLVMLRPERLPR